MAGFFFVIMSEIARMTAYTAEKPVRQSLHFEVSNRDWTFPQKPQLIDIRKAQFIAK